MKRPPLRCPTCGDMMWSRQLRQKASPLKMRIVEALLAAGADGMLAEHLIERVQRPMTLQCLNVHIVQINKLMAGTGLRIYGRARQKYLVEE